MMLLLTVSRSKTKEWRMLVTNMSRISDRETKGWGGGGGGGG